MNGVELDWANGLGGMPHGSVLRPSLFVIFMNDLPASVYCSISLYADDAIVYGPVFDQASTSVIQKHLDSVMEWS